jgi:hypothetical protein
MKTKKVVMPRVSAAFSTAVSSSVTVTLSRAPWDVEPNPEPTVVEALGEKRREPRHLGTYKKRPSEE